MGTPIKESYAIWQEHYYRQLFMEDLIRPGIMKCKVYAACEAGLKHVDEYVGWIRGVVMDVHEEPQLGSLLPL